MAKAAAQATATELPAFLIDPIAITIDKCDCNQVRKTTHTHTHTNNIQCVVCVCECVDVVYLYL